MFQISNFNFTRGFSTSVQSCKHWKHVVSRKVAKRPTYQIGDEKPKYIPNRQITPDYKYGESKFFPRSNRGLYGGSFIQSGHKISEFRQKANRFWKPNSHKKSLWSETLNKSLTFQVTAKVLKTIDKEGGLDNYLIKEKSARIKELGPFGWKLRYQVLKRKAELENPIHKNAKQITDSDGSLKTIYYGNVKVTNDEEPSSLNITVGRRRLLKELYETEKRETKALGEPITAKAFSNKYRHLPASELITKLASHNYDFSNVTV